MDIEKLKNTFKNYVENYDMTDLAILRKFYHSYRVMDFCMLLAKHNHFNTENTELAILIGLLHDYSRFEQWTKFKTYNDNLSIDHGDLAVKRLFEEQEIKNYCTNDAYYDRICTAIKYHNKYDYPTTLSKDKQLLCQLIRDADKLDIFYLLGMNLDLIQEDNEPISPNIKNDFYHHKLLKHSDTKNESDKVVLKLAMVFDLRFDYSFEYLYNTKLMDRIFMNIQNKEKFKPYFDYINNYIRTKVQKEKNLL